MSTTGALFRFMGQQNLKAPVVVKYQGKDLRIENLYVRAKTGEVVIRLKDEE